LSGGFPRTILRVPVALADLLAHIVQHKLPPQLLALSKKLDEELLKSKTDSAVA
jgi:hypothetical protein